jgi:hypothetical protein
MSACKKIGWLLVAVALLAGAQTVHGKVPTVVSQIPDNAVIAITVPSLSRLSNKIALVNQKLALNQPQMNNVLGFAKAMSGMSQGINDGGGAAVVLTSLPMPGAGAEPDVILLLPVSDYGAFLGNFGSKSNNGVTRVQFMNQSLFVKKSGQFAVAGPSQQLVKQFTRPSGKSVTDRAGQFGHQVMTHSDISVFVDLARIEKMVRPLIGPQLAQMKTQVQQLSGLDPQAGKFLDAYLKVYADILTTVLRDGDVIINGIDVSPEGIGFTYSCQFKPGSQLASVFASNPAQAPKLDRLPTVPYVVAMTFDGSTLPMKQWAQELCDAFPDDTPFSALIGSSKDLMGQFGGKWQSVIFTPGSDPTQRNILTSGLWVVESPEPAKFVQSYQGYLNALNSLEMAEFSYSTQVEPSAIEVAERKIDQYIIKVNAPEQVQKQFASHGPLFEAQKGAIFQTDDAVVVAFNPNKETLAQADIAAEGKGGLNGDHGIAITRRHLPKNGIGQMFISVAPVLEKIPGMKPVGNQNLPPIGLGAGIHEGSIGVRGFVPMRVITTLKNIGMKTMMLGGNPFRQTKR